MAWEQSQADKKIVWDAFNPGYQLMVSASIGYGQIAVRSAFILNGGILFVLPTYLSATTANGASLDTTNLVYAAGSFVVGILLSAIPCLCAYYNFTWQAHNIEYERHIEFMRIDEAYDETHKFRLGKAREESIESLEIMNRKLENYATWSYRAGVLFMFSSYVSFVIGCYFAAVLMIKT